MEPAYLCIDLKSFYASVECVDHGYDPFEECLVVADTSRGRGTICLAITPAMKALGVRNRCRLFEIPPDVRYRAVRPRMRRYMEVSAQIYGLYLRYFSPQDVHVYSVDECFIDLAPYVALYGRTPRQMACDLMDLVMRETGICATAGLGPNLFLAKVALDVTAKHAPDNIGELDEELYKVRIWPHRPITDIWGIGPGIARRLAHMGADCMGQVAMLDLDMLRREFGVNAEILYDHAWGREECTMAQVKAYRPKAHSCCSGQVLPRDYATAEARTVVREMADGLVLDLVEKGVACSQVSLSLGYSFDRAELMAQQEARLFEAGHGTQMVGARVPTSGASHKLAGPTNSREELMAQFLGIFDQVAVPGLKVRRINLGAGGLVPEELAPLSLLDDVERQAQERSLSRTTTAIKRRFGRNALVRGASLRDEATGRERNQQVGGHHE